MANKPLLWTIAVLIGGGSVVTYSAFASLVPDSPSMDDAGSVVGSVVHAAISTSAPAEPAPMATPNKAPLAYSVAGTWIQAKHHGEDGLSRCGDFNSPALYRLNGQMGEVAAFDVNGAYKALFAYTTPSGEDHTTQYSANWKQDGGKLNLEHWVAQDAFRNESDLETRALRFDGENVVHIDDERFVRCVGTTGLDE